MKKAILKAQEWDRRSRGRIVKLNIRRSLAAIFPTDSYRMYPDDYAMHPDDYAMYADLLATLRHLDWTKLKECYMEGVDLESFFAMGHGTGFVHQRMEALTASYEYSHEIVFGREYAELPWESLRTFSITNGGG